METYDTLFYFLQVLGVAMSVSLWITGLTIEEVEDDV